MGYDETTATNITCLDASAKISGSGAEISDGVITITQGAKKAKSDNIEGGLYQSEIFSYTYKRKVTLLVAKDWITARDRVLIIDDFLARGEAMRGLIDIVTQAGAELAGIGVAVEKGFQHGGDQLRQAGYPLKSLAILDKADKDGFTFRED